jgi:branched-chain amino acid transport system substrate-binding protein
MLLDGKIRRFSGAVFGAHIAISALAVGAFIPTSAAAQTGEPLKIGYSMALSGGLGPNGRSALLAQKIWEEDTNAKGGLLGRPIPRPYPPSMPSCSTSTRSS